MNNVSIEKAFMPMMMVVMMAAVIQQLIPTQEAPAPIPPAPPSGLANLYGKVTDASTGKGIPGVLVVLDGGQTSTDSNGNYVFTNLEVGEYEVEFSKEGYESMTY